MSAREQVREVIRPWRDAWVPGLPGGRVLSPPPIEEAARSTLDE